MKRFLLLAAVVSLMLVALGDVAWAQLRGGAGTPFGDERRSMGNLRPDTTQPAPSPSASGGVLNHRPYSYGNPPYYRRPPVTPYYVVPQVVYPRSYYGGYPYGGYYTVPYPVGPRPYVISPYRYRYVPMRPFGF